MLISETAGFLDAVQSQLKNCPEDRAQSELLFNFLLRADKFSNLCCVKLAGILRESSRLPEVRDTSEPILAHLIRSRCFETLDSVLSAMLETLWRLNHDLRPLSARLVESRVREALAGLQQSPNRGLSGRMAGSKSTPVLKVWEYLKALDGFMQEFLDYGASKLYGGDVDPLFQKHYLQTARQGLYDPLRQALALAEDFNAVKERKWRELRANEDKKIKEAVFGALQHSKKRKTGMTSLLIGTVCAVPPWFLWGASGGANATFVLFGIVSGLLALFFICRAVVNLTKA